MIFFMNERRTGDVVILEIQGHKQHLYQLSQEITDKVDALLKDGCRKFIFDLATVELRQFGSSGIATLIRQFKTISESNGHVVFTNLTERAYIFIAEVSRLNRVMPFRDTVEDALEYLKSVDDQPPPPISQE